MPEGVDTGPEVVVMDFPPDAQFLDGSALAPNVEVSEHEYDANRIVVRFSFSFFGANWQVRWACSELLRIHSLWLGAYT